MCQTCGCAVAVEPRTVMPDADVTTATTPADPHRRSVAVLQALLADNDRQAAHNRAHFDAAGVLAINLMSSPGAGKTALLEATIEALRQVQGGPRVGVIEGDLETDNDARRIRDHGVPAVQITTGGGCHLDAAMIHDALGGLDLPAVDIVFIENVGNLVCPAGFDLGHHHSVALLSVTEGDDKPAKYPVMFRAVELVLVSKSDLLPYVGDFDVARAEAAVRRLASEAAVMTISARDGSGVRDWVDWLGARLAHRRRLAARSSAALSDAGLHHHHDHGQAHCHQHGRGA